MKRKDLLPARRLVASDSDAGVSLRDGRGPRVVVTMHAMDCPGCLGYLRTLSAASDSAAAWDGRFLAVVPGPRSGTPAPAGIPIFFDPEGVMAEGQATAVVADEWGEVFFAADGGDGHDLPAAGELVEWLRFAAIQCPECEGPEGEWRTLDRSGL